MCERYDRAPSISGLFGDRGIGVGYIYILGFSSFLKKTFPEWVQDQEGYPLRNPKVNARIPFLNVSAGNDSDCVKI